MDNKALRRGNALLALVTAAFTGATRWSQYDDSRGLSMGTSAIRGGVAGHGSARCARLSRGK